MTAAIYVRKSSEQNQKGIGAIAAIAVVLLISCCAPAFGQVGRYQLIGGSILLDTMTGCAWQMFEDPTVKRTYFASLPRMGVGPGRNELRPLTSRECLTVPDGVMEDVWQKKFDKGDR